MAKLGRIVLAGGSGFIGTALCEYFRHSAEEIVILSRRAHKQHHNVRYLQWDGRTMGEWANALDGAEFLVNLSGKSVNCRYTDANMREIYASRVEPTTVLAAAVNKASHPPSTWVQLTSATIYRHSEYRPQDEETGEFGSGFSVDVCRTWEQAFLGAALPSTKRVVLRVGLVLGTEDGVFPPLKNLVRFGLGGHQGDGRQMMSWIHMQDLCRIVEWVHHNATDGQIYNSTAPGAVPNRHFMGTFRQLYGMPIGLPSPQWLLEAGSHLIRTEVELILKSRWVEPRRLLDAGFQFQFPDIHSALADILWRRV